MTHPPFDCHIVPDPRVQAAEIGNTKFNYTSGKLEG